MLRRPFVFSVALGALTLGGCSSVPAVTLTLVASITPSGDGTLRIGTLFPMTGHNAASGDSQVAGTERAVRDILAEQTTPTHAVQLIHRNSAGDLAAVYADLAAQGVDLVLWDALTALPADAQGSASSAAIVALSDCSNGGHAVGC